MHKVNPEVLNSVSESFLGDLAGNAFPGPVVLAMMYCSFSLLSFIESDNLDVVATEEAVEAAQRGSGKLQEVIGRL